jgi:hypothetical protein
VDRDAELDAILEQGEAAGLVEQLMSTSRVGRPCA